MRRQVLVSLRALHQTSQNYSVFNIFGIKLHSFHTSTIVFDYRAVRNLVAEGNVALATKHFFQEPNSFDANLLISKRLLSLDDSFKAYYLLKEKSLLNYFVIISLISYCRTENSDRSTVLWDDLSKIMLTLQEEYKKKVNPPTWNYIIKGFCNSGHVSTTFELLKYVKSKHIPLEPKTFSTLLNTLANSKMSKKAKEIYFSMKEYGVSPDIIHFNCMMKAFIENGEIDEAMVIYRQEKDLIPNEVTYILLLKGCSFARSLVNGKKLHETIMKNYELYTSITVRNSLINMFSKCGETQTAIEIFMKMLETKQLDDATWTLIIPTYYEEGRLEEIENIIISEGVPPTSVFVFNVLMDSFLKSGKLEHAESIFNQMKFKDVITWNSFLNGCHENGDTKRLLQYFKSMPKHIQPNDVTITIMLNFFANNSMEQEAYFMFENMYTLFKITRTTAHYGCMIKLCANLKKMPKAISFYEDMINNNMVPDIPTFILLLSVCSDFGNLDFGKIIHRNISNLRLSDHKLFNVLINMYAKCGDLQSALEVFQSVPNKDVVTWTTFINAYGIHGIGSKAVELLDQMCKQNIKPNEHTLTCVLHACGHCGMVDEAKEIYNSMESKYSIKPSNLHIACLIDALARKGNIEEAEQLLSSCSNPDVVTVSTLFGACRKFNNVSLAEKLFKILIERNEVESSHFILMANIYASLDMHDNAKRVREMMESSGYKKLPGITQVCVDGKIHTFVCEEKNHPEMKMIEKELNKMIDDLIKAGYQPDISWVIKNVDSATEKLDLLCKHSEKIAMAFVFSKQPNISTIRLTKNLRVCGDCHNATKLLSSVRNCEIIVRDASRFHHFKDGKCSCGDYW